MAKATKTTAKKIPQKKTTDEPAEDLRDPIRVAIGERIHELRLSLGQTVREFTAPLGIDHTTLVKIEKGFIGPSFQTLIDIASLHQRNIHYLVTGKGPQYNISEKTLDKLRGLVVQMDTLLK